MDTDLTITFNVLWICNTFVVPITHVRTISTRKNLGFLNFVSSLK